MASRPAPVPKLDVNDGARGVGPRERFLPLLVGAVLFITLVFVGVMKSQMYAFHQRFQVFSPADTAVVWEQVEFPAGGSSPPEIIKAKHLRLLGLLEGYALSRRYHQVEAMILLQATTRQIGFLTGMLLALMGAAFVVSRLRDPSTRLEALQLRVSLITSSPGIVLAVMGTLLMIVTLSTKAEIQTFERAIYLPPLGMSPPVGVPPELPVTLPSGSGGRTDSPPSISGEDRTDTATRSSKELDELAEQLRRVLDGATNAPGN